MMSGGELFDRIEASPHGADPAALMEASHRAARILVRGGHATDDPALVERVVHLAETEGLEALAELWSTAAPATLPGVLWRLYLLRSWVHHVPRTAAREYELGRHRVPVADAISGVADPPGPEEVQRLADEVLRGVVRGDLADTLFRAAAFARVTAAGRAAASEEMLQTGAQDTSEGSDAAHRSDISAARLQTLADQLDQAARLEMSEGLR